MFIEVNKIFLIFVCIIFLINEVIFVYVGSGIWNFFSFCIFIFCLFDEI